MNRLWTHEDRQRQAEKIRSWQPWQHSTGPKTEEGKETSKMNACISGAYSAEIKKLKGALRDHNKIVLG